MIHNHTEEKKRLIQETLKSSILYIFSGEVWPLDAKTLVKDRGGREQSHNVKVSINCMLFTKGKGISTMEKSGKPPFNQIIKGNICNNGTNGLYLPLTRCTEETTRPREIPAKKVLTRI